MYKRRLVGKKKEWLQKYDSLWWWSTLPHQLFNFHFCHGLLCWCWCWCWCCCSVLFCVSALLLWSYNISISVIFDFETLRWGDGGLPSPVLVCKVKVVMTYILIRCETNANSPVWRFRPLIYYIFWWNREISCRSCITTYCTLSSHLLHSLTRQVDVVWFWCSENL